MKEQGLLPELQSLPAQQLGSRDNSMQIVVTAVCLGAMLAIFVHPTSLISAEATNTIEKVSMRDLLDNKEKWKGKKVEVTGYFVSDFETRALYECAMAVTRTNNQPSLWIDFPSRESVAKGRITAMTRSFIRVIGTFEFRVGAGCGYLGQWPAKLTSVELMEPVLESKKPKLRDK